MMSPSPWDYNKFLDEHNPYFPILINKYNFIYASYPDGCHTVFTGPGHTPIDPEYVDIGSLIVLVGAEGSALSTSLPAGAIGSLTQDSTSPYNHGPQTMISVGAACSHLGSYFQPFKHFYFLNCSKNLR
jgi:hypothetical protein